jgi:hypothetical protein
MSTYFSQRRLVKRSNCCLKGKYAVEDSSSHELHCEDISSKGARVRTVHPLAVNSSFSFDIAAENADPMPVAGKVCWCKQTSHGFRAGICFDRTVTVDVNAVT